LRRSIILLLLLLMVHPAWAHYPQRIISGIPSVTEMLFAVGAGSKVVGVTTNCNYPPEVKKIDKVGGYSLNLEKLSALKPDLIILLEEAQKPEIGKLRDFGLPVLAINARTVAEVMSSLTKLGEVTGNRGRAERLVAGMKSRINAVKPRGIQPRVLVIVGFNPLIVAGGGTFIDDVVKYAGGMNIARNVKGAFPQYSIEMLSQEKPDFIILPEGSMNRTEIKNEIRGRGINSKLIIIDADILTRPGPRVVEAIEKITGAIND